MTVLNPPSWIQQGSHSATHDRLALAGLIAQHGPADSTSMLVTQNSPVGMSVRVGVGGCWVPGTAVANQGSYHVFNDGTVSVTIATADPSFPRKDLVVARVQDADQFGSVNSATIEVIAGTPSSTPVLPASPVNTTIIAVITVPVAATVTANGGIINSNIVQTGTPVILHGGVMPAPSAAARSALPLYDGYPVYRTDTNNIEVFNGVSWDVFESAVRHGISANYSLSYTTESGSPVTVNNWGWQGDTDGYQAGAATSTTTPITIPAGLGGVYTISFGFLQSGTRATGRSFAQIIINGTMSPSNLSNTYRFNLYQEDVGGGSVTIPLSAGQTISFQVFYTNGGVSKALSGSLSCYRVAA